MTSSRPPRCLLLAGRRTWRRHAGLRLGQRLETGTWPGHGSIPPGGGLAHGGGCLESVVVECWAAMIVCGFFLRSPSPSSSPFQRLPRFQCLAGPAWRLVTSRLFSLAVLSSRRWLVSKTRSPDPWRKMNEGTVAIAAPSKRDLLSTGSSSGRRSLSDKASPHTHAPSSRRSSYRLLMSVPL